MAKTVPAILFLFFILSAIILSCNTTQTKDEVTLDMEGVIQNTKEVRLSEIAERIEYIKLETNENALISNGRGARVLLENGYILISQRGIPLLVFDESGKYLRSIGSIGRGPGEYNIDYSFAFNERNERIYIFNVTRKAIHCFDIRGNYIHDIKPQESVIAFDYIGNDLFCGCLPCISNNGSSMYNYIIFDNNGEIKKKHYIPGEATSRTAGPESGTFFTRVIPPKFVKSPSGVNIFTSQNDSIFTIYKDGSMKISFSWDLGKFDSGYDFLDQESEKPESGKFIDTFMAFESEKNWFIYFNKADNPHRALYSKQQNEYYEILPLGKTLVNDIDGGPSFWPNFNSNEGKSFATLLDPVRVKRSMENGDFDNINIKYPQKNHELVKLFSSLSENDNPVIRIVHLK
mgnify:CR=1 FL=1